MSRSQRVFCVTCERVAVSSLGTRVVGKSSPSTRVPLRILDADTSAPHLLFLTRTEDEPRSGKWAFDVSDVSIFFMVTPGTEYLSDQGSFSGSYQTVFVKLDVGLVPRMHLLSLRNRMSPWVSRFAHVTSQAFEDAREPPASAAAARARCPLPGAPSEQTSRVCRPAASVWGDAAWAQNHSRAPCPRVRPVCLDEASGRWWWEDPGHPRWDRGRPWLVGTASPSSASAW